MARYQRSLDLSDRFRRGLMRHRNQVVRTVAGLWRSVDIRELDASFALFVAAATPLIASGQTASAVLAGEYYAGFVGSELDRDEPTPEPTIVGGRTRDGRPVRAVLAPTIASVKIALGQRRSPSTALQVGLARAVRTTRTEVTDAGRTALTAMMSSDRRVAGWRRVTDADPCGACLALSAGGPFPADARMAQHPSCSCTQEPVLLDVPDRATRLAGMDLFAEMSRDRQDRLFAGRGGAEKAELLRNGDIDLDDLVATHRHPQWDDTVTETPLADLQPA